MPQNLEFPRVKIITDADYKCDEFRHLMVQKLILPEVRLHVK